MYVSETEHKKKQEESKMAEKQTSSSKLVTESRPTIKLPPRPTMESIFNGVSSYSPGPWTFVNGLFADPPPETDNINTSTNYFTQLLTSPTGTTYVGSSSNETFHNEYGIGPKQNRPMTGGVSPFYISGGFSPSYLLAPQTSYGVPHQAVAEVAAQAQQHRQMQFEYQPSFAAEPAYHHNMFPSTSIIHNSVVESVEASQSEKKNHPLITVDKPADDGYNWRKYGQKPIKGCEYPRSYYKCTHPNCPVKKKVERSSQGQITHIIYRGQHSHDMPQPNKRAKDGGFGLSESQIAGKYQEQFLPRRLQVVETSDSDGGVTEIRDDEEEEEDDENECYPKRRKTGADSAMAVSHNSVTEPKVIVQTRSEVDLLDDGYRWRKYGQKVVKGNKHPRSYYKCSTGECNVRKHVERASTDPKAVITTYDGKHNHDVPTARNSSANSNAQHLRPRPGDERSLLNGLSFTNNGQGPALLRLKEERS